jgi:hypothetical protein
MASATSAATLERMDPSRHARRRWVEHVPFGPLGALAFLILGLAAAALVLVVIPRGFDIESSCITATGLQRTGGDDYVGAFVLLGTLGWLATFLGMIFANIADRRRLAALLPFVWFSGLLVAALAVAILVGPAPCPSAATATR